MPQALLHSHVTCPYCYSRFTVPIDLSVGDQNYYEDCQVCCAPLELIIHTDDQGDLARIEVRRGNG